MSKVSISLQRVDGINASLEQTGAIYAEVTGTSHFNSTLTKIASPFCVKFSHRVGPELSAFKIGNITCTLVYVWDTNIGGPYLEISPNIIWVYSNLEATNDVFSNTTWEIN